MEKNNEGKNRLESIKDYISNNWKPNMNDSLDQPKYMTTTEIKTDLFHAMQIEFNQNDIAKCMNDLNFSNILRREPFTKESIKRYWVLFN